MFKDTPFDALKKNNDVLEEQGTTFSQPLCPEATRDDKAGEGDVPFRSNGVSLLLGHAKCTRTSVDL